MPEPGYESAIDFSLRLFTLIVDPLIFLIGAVALFLFLYGLLKFISSSDGGDEKLREGKKHIIWGLVGLFVIAFVKIILSFLNSASGFIF